MTTRRAFLRTCASALATGSLTRSLTALAEQAATHGRRRPNFILILADDLGYGDLGCYGHAHNQTPHLDQLAREGLRFTDFHANGPMCSPTRAALLTGLYQNRFGKPFEAALSAKSPEIGLPPEAITIPEILKQADYATGIYGKWHLGYQPPNMPTHFGFDDFRGLLTGDGDHISHVSRSGAEDWYHNETIEMEEGYSSELITRHSIDFMRKNKDNPFFLFVSHLIIHFPWQAPGEEAHRNVGTDYWSLEKLGPHPEGAVRPVVQKMVEALDDSVGAIMDALRELHLDENTFVLFLSDNGGYLDYQGRFQGEISSNAPMRGQKTDVWEGGHRVPAIAWWPGHIESGGVTHATAMTMDILPTCALLAGVAPPDRLDGVSLVSHLLEGAALPQRDLFWRIGDARAVRRGPWKLVLENGEPCLFNLADDIGEQHDIASRRPELVKDLLDALKAWEQEMDADPMQGSPGHLADQKNMSL